MPYHGSMVSYCDYQSPQGAFAAIEGHLVPLKDAAPVLAENAMKLAVHAEHKK